MNFYEILEVSPQAPNDEIKNAFRRLAKKYHPDVNENEEASNHFQLIYLAYNILQDSEKRKIYDALQQLKHSIPLSGREIDDMHRWKNHAASQAQAYSEMPYTEFEDTFLSKIGFHSTQLLAFILFFMLLCGGIMGLLIGGHYIFEENFSGAKILGYAFWLFGGTFTFTSIKAIWGIFETWRN